MPYKWPPEKRRELIAAIADGLSSRQAAAQIGVGVATAVRWKTAAGLSRSTAKRLTSERRAALVVAMEEGETPDSAARRFGVSRGLAVRLAPPRSEARAQAKSALFAMLEQGWSRRRAAAVLGLSVATAIRWAQAANIAAKPPPRSRLARAPRFRPDRDAKRAELLAAIAGGLSRRKAAAEVGLPVATAIRWANAALNSRND